MAVVQALELSDEDGAARYFALLDLARPGSAAAAFARGELLFYQGRYDEAVAEFERAQADAPNVGIIERHRAIAASTRQVVDGFATHRTADGLFEIRFDAARDAVLIPWAEETLEAAYYEIGYDTGSWPTPPIRVEIYPRASTLAEVSTLTREAVEASGTIALCKYGKLMLTSPRATLQGYDWRTTLAHEYVHYAVSDLVHAEVPIWMHEALAKYLEARWTGARAASLDPTADALLGERVRSGDLITFAQMHPSMAYLPTPEDASTAYAEVFTVMEYLVSRRGPSILRDVLTRVREGDDALESVAGAIGEPFDVFEANWMRYLAQRPTVEIPGRVSMEIELVGRDQEGSGDPAVSADAQRYLRLGELLRARGQLDAAVFEYGRAASVLGDAHPVLQAALARVLLDLGRPDDALAAIAAVERWYPNYYPLPLRRGEALLALGRPADAVEPLTAAGGVNPFDPAVHTHLARAHEVLGNAALAARHRDFAQQVER